MGWTPTGLQMPASVFSSLACVRRGGSQGGPSTESGLEDLVAGTPCVVIGSTGMTRNKGFDFKTRPHLGKILPKAFYRENKSVVEEWSFKMFLQTQKFSAIQTQRQPDIRLHLSSQFRKLRV